MATDLPSILARYPAPLQPRGEVEPLGTAGGLSGARLWRFRTEVGTVALKAWPAPNTDPDRLRAIHGWLERAKESGWLAIPFRNSRGETVSIDDQGVVWDLSPWLSGHAMAPKPTSIGEVARALATLHRNWRPLGEIGPSPGLARRREELEWLTRGGFARIRAEIAGWPEHHPIRPLVAEWLDGAEPRAGAVLESLHPISAIALPLQPCFRDLRGDHILFGEDGRLAGIIDYGAMGPESIAGDLARLSIDWLGQDAEATRSFLAAYEEARPLDAGERRALGSFRDALGLLIGWRWFEMAAIRKVFVDPSIVSEGFRRGIAALGALQKNLLTS